MEEISENYFKLIDIFNQAQETSSCHQKCVVNLRRIFKIHNNFFHDFKKVLTCILHQDIKSKNEYVNRSLDFICSFLKNESLEDSNLLEQTLNFLLEVHDIKNENVRYRSCQIINILFNHMVGGEISDDLCDAVQEALLERLEDKKTEIRLQAVAALYRLQNPSDLSDPIINAYLLHLEYDLSSKVRKVCIEKVAPRKDVIPIIVEKTRDVDVQVRIAAFSKLTKLVKFITIENRQNIIKTGFRDPSESVRDFVSKTLISSWLELYESSITEFLRSIRLDADENDITETKITINFILSGLFRSKTQRELFDVLPQNSDKLIPLNQLTWETMSYWRFLVEKLREDDKYENLLNEVLPELIEFTSYIEQFCTWAANNLDDVKNLEFNCIVREMFEITYGYDFSDVAICQSLNKTIKNLLLSNDWFSEETIKQIIKNLDRSIPNTSEQIQFVCELISQFLNPQQSDGELEDEKDKQLKIAELKFKRYKLQEEQEGCIKKEDFMRAASIKKEILEVQNCLSELETINNDEKEENIETKIYEPKNLIKSLDIVGALLISPKIGKLSKELRSLKDDVIESLLIHPDKTIKVKAMSCYSLLSILDRPTAEIGIHIFSAYISSYYSGKECDPDILLISIQTVGDLIVLFGSKLVVAPEDQGLTDSVNEQQLQIFAGGSSLTSIIQALVDLMDDDNPKVQEAAGYALCNLIMSRRIQSSTLLSRMILKWCNPASDESETIKLKQMIGRMLEKLPTLPDSDKVIERAFILTIKVLVKAPDDSALADVNINKIIKCLLELLYAANNDNAHNSLAKSLCEEIVDKNKSLEAVYFSKTLLLLRLSNTDKTSIDQLLEYCDEIRHNTSNKHILNDILKFSEALLHLL